MTMIILIASATSTTIRRTLATALGRSAGTDLQGMAGSALVGTALVAIADRPSVDEIVSWED
jgi:hypothetical protein